mmetsp:Transcript_5351/g.7347  ORF Transcript_5351/g.7347 Transcript_5351/m.7347 type:complete len:96 (+) Transcript_5351:700-987(+)
MAAPMSGLVPVIMTNTGSTTIPEDRSAMLIMANVCTWLITKIGMAALFRWRIAGATLTNTGWSSARGTGEANARTQSFFVGNNLWVYTYVGALKV